MGRSAINQEAPTRSLPKTPTGIPGFDAISGGGLPRGRTSLVCGGAGCGKTLFAMQFLIHGAERLGEPGVLLTFEETAAELAQNVRSLGVDLEDLFAQKKLLIDFVQVEPSQIEETGEYDLEGLFIRLAHAIDSIGARRVVLDTIETLFGGLSNTAILRSELRRLFRWLKDRQVTAIITGERGDGALTRQGLEEYVSDCVIALDHRVSDQLSTRRLRIVKYRGTAHGTNEYPFMIDESGISVLPVTSVGLLQEASDERISTGVSGLDEMLGGEGVYRGSTVLISGTAGTGKTSMAAFFADAACRRGERSLYFTFEESQSQMVRNMRSIGLELGPWLKKGLLLIRANRPTGYGLESLLGMFHKEVDNFQPSVVVVDPVTAFEGTGSSNEAESMLVRVLDFFKSQRITTLLTSVDPAGSAKGSQSGISSLIDTWLLVRDLELGGERNRGIYILKSRGMSHSNQIREFLLTDHGVELKDAYLGLEGVFTGSMRLVQEARDQTSALSRQHEIERCQRDLERKRQVLAAQTAALQAQFESEQEHLELLITQQRASEEVLRQGRELIARSRNASTAGGPRNRSRRITTQGGSK